MKAVGYTAERGSNSADCLQELEVDEPLLGEHDVLVEVEAVSVNPVDCKIRRNRAAQPQEPVVLGWDAVGSVLNRGASVVEIEVGDRVWYAGDLQRPGSNARRQVVDARIASRAPRGLPTEQAAALPLTTLTAWELLTDRLGAAEPDTASTNHVESPRSATEAILVVGAAGGVGSVLVQLARAAGLYVIGTASRPESAHWVQRMGAHVVVDHRQDLVRQVEAIGQRPVTRVALLTHSAEHFSAAASLVAPQGRIGIIDDPDGPLDISLLKQKSASLHWEFMFTRSMFDTADLSRQSQILARAAAMVDDGRLVSTMHTNLGPITAGHVRQGHRLLETGRTIGKIVLAGWD